MSGEHFVAPQSETCGACLVVAAGEPYHGGHVLDIASACH